MSDRESDQELLRRSAAGDKAAFSLLVTRHQGALYRFARTLTRHDADAEDVLQQTFLQAFRGAATARAEGEGALGWLFTIARHAAYRHGRRRAGEPAGHEDIHKLGERAGFADEGASPEALAALLEQRATLERTLASLGEEDREILLLRDVEGLSGDEAAAVLEIGLAAQKSRLHRARLRFLEALRKEGGP